MQVKVYLFWYMSEKDVNCLFEEKFQFLGEMQFEYDFCGAEIVKIDFLALALF
jgi:hypothetical protein